MDTELLLHANLNGKAVGVPSCAAVYLVARLGLVTAYRVLDGTGHYVMDSRHSVGGRRTFKEYEFRRSFPYFK